MSNIISVWGSPCSGKTTIATKIALNYISLHKRVALICCDNQAPALPVLFPNWKPDDLFSIGTALAQEEVIDDSIYSNCITMKKYSNLIVLGYKDAENKFSYPRLTSYKVVEFIHVLSEIVDYIIFDCCSDLEDIISNTAIQNSNVVLRLHTPEIKSVSWSTSQLAMYGTTQYKIDDQIVCLNNVTNDIYAPSEEIKSFLKVKTIELPYSRVLKMQMATGSLFEKQTQKIFAKYFNNLIKEIDDKLQVQNVTNYQEDSDLSMLDNESEFGVLDDSKSEFGILDDTKN